MSEQFISLSQVTKRVDQTPKVDLAVYNTETARLMGEHVISLGLMTGAGLVQGDIAATLHLDPQDSSKGSDKPLCWINCGIEGGYNCPARRSANPGLTTKGLAPSEKISQAFKTAAQGIEFFNRQFIENGSLDKYCELFHIPDNIKAGIGYNLLNGKITANIFGGEATVHPDVLQIAKACHEAGMIVNLTTTGDILLTQKGQPFIDGLSQGYIDTLAVSGEFKDAEDVKRLANLSLDELKKERICTPFNLGQVRKRVAAAYVGQLSETNANFPQLVFNIVVHENNIDHIEEILIAIDKAFPHAKSNPYPAQSAFEYAAPAFRADHVSALQSFAIHRLVEQKTKNSHRVLRPHYYAMLAAVFRAFPNNPQAIQEHFSGYKTWRCYENRYGISGAGTVVQFGASPEIRILPDHAGDTFSCFWSNATITRQGKHVSDMKPQEVADHINGGMQEIASSLKNSCEGCLFPRLTGDMISQDLGLDPFLFDAYKEILGTIVEF